MVVLAGRFGATSSHHHPAVQVTVAVEGEVVVSDDRDSRTARAVVIPSGVRHALIPADDTTRVLSLYLHPGSLDGRALAPPGTVDCRPADWVAAGEPAQHVDTSPDAPLIESAEEILTALRGPAPGGKPLHPKLRGALTLLGASLPRKLYLQEIAEAVSMSQSGLSRLFVSETGVSFPASVRWARLLYAVGLVESGATITDAAHAAGFTDSAHATRVCREMAGVPPSVLVKAVRDNHSRRTEPRM
jgi:AraC-like DNA-binding protein